MCFTPRIARVTSYCEPGLRRAVVQADFTNSALTEHAWNHSQPVDWDSVKVLCHPHAHAGSLKRLPVFTLELLEKLLIGIMVTPSSQLIVFNFTLGYLFLIHIFYRNVASVNKENKKYNYMTVLGQL